MSPLPEPNRLEEVRNFSAQLLQRLDQAQATISPYNDAIAAASAAGLLPPTFLVGEVAYQEPYEPDSLTDSGVAYLATLSVPSGFGAAFFDLDQLPCNLDEISDSEMRRRNIPFADLPPRVQLRLLVQVPCLVDRLLIEIGAKDLRSLPQFQP